jgi:hypothetical protein
LSSMSAHNAPVTQAGRYLLARCREGAELPR